MSSDDSFDFWLAVEAVLVASTVFGMGMQAPYGEFTRQARAAAGGERWKGSDAGKHGNDSLGDVQLSPRFGWWLMELPASVAFLATWLATPAGAPSSLTSHVLATLW